jgi:hypothetical protein
MCPSDGKVPSEHEEQVGFVFWFRQRYPDVLIFSIPNGARVGMGQAKKLVAEGLTAGVPDLFIPEWALFVEMKKRKGTLSQDQKALIPRLEKIGMTVIVGNGAEDASRKIIVFAKDRKK